jgi:hypothetical protein
MSREDVARLVSAIVNGTAPANLTVTELAKALANEDALILTTPRLTPYNEGLWSR